MSKQYHIFFVHGIGIHSENWVKDDGVEELMEELWGNYSKLNNLGSFSSIVECHSIYYDNIFQKYYDDWNELGKAIENSVGMNTQWKIELSNALENFQNGEDRKNFFYTHFSFLKIASLVLVLPMSIIKFKFIF